MSALARAISVTRLVRFALAIALAQTLPTTTDAHPMNRYIYVIYDISLSYQSDPDLSLEMNRRANLRRIEHIGATISASDYFIFSAMGDLVRDDCDGAKYQNKIPTNDVPGYIHRPELGEYGSAVWSHNFLSAFQKTKEKLNVDIDPKAQGNPAWTEYTDLTGALYHASRLFREFPANRNYLLIFSDLHDTPKFRTRAGLCGPLSFPNTKVIVVDFGWKLSDKVTGRRPSPKERLANLDRLLRKSGAIPVLVDGPDEHVLRRLNIEP